MVNPQSELREDGWEEDVMGDKADKESRGQVVTTTLRGGGGCYLHFIDEDTEVTKDQESVPLGL